MKGGVVLGICLLVPFLPGLYWRLSRIGFEECEFSTPRPRSEYLRGEGAAQSLGARHPTTVNQGCLLVLQGRGGIVKFSPN